ncbi:hypothetical protein [Sphingopyxis sp. MWB1]|uniref:hypothetical protein n=1 Tax=Sphingopyxis sp. MWB1 TaxID=1537715 RepID=UPI000B3312B4|nr:hypothetical protein [Sphingopyxis sp. MWB1]
MKQAKQRMCVINPALVEDIAPLVGGQADIMTRIGISWNTWIKISGGRPVRYSLAQRFKARVVANAEKAETLGRKFPSPGGGIDRDALDSALLLSNAS